MIMDTQHVELVIKPHNKECPTCDVASMVLILQISFREMIITQCHNEGRYLQVCKVGRTFESEQKVYELTISRHTLALR